MAPRSYAQRSLCVNSPADPIEEQYELAGQSLVQRLNAKSNEASTKAPIPPKASTPPLVPLSIKNLFTKFMKVFMETTQAQAQVLAKPQKQLFKAWTPKTYWGKFHMKSYYSR